MYDDILIATDGSPASEAAVEQGVELAARTDATVHLLTVVDTGTEMSAAAVGAVAEELTETLEGMATEAIEAATDRAEAAGVPHDRGVIEGFPEDAIAERAAECDADLVVLGATGRSGVADHLLGSTTERVARSVDASVLIARPAE